MGSLPADQFRDLGFKSADESVLISDRCVIYDPARRSIGDNLRVDVFCVLAGEEEVAPFEHLERLATRAMAFAWWSGPVVPVVAARSDAGSSCARYGPDGVEIRLARPQWTPVTLTHELAHVLAGLDAGHGPNFRRAHIDVVASALGHEAGCWLRDAYVACGLSVPPAERIVEPAAPTDGPIAL